MPGVKGTDDPDAAMTALLDAVSHGRDGSEAALLEVVYDELRAIAGSFFRTERRDHTLEPTALVHEAFVKLVRGPEVSVESRAHFIAIAARAMRRVLIDHARAKRAQKRGENGERYERVTLSAAAMEESAAPLDAIDVNHHLERLAAIDERQARIVEMRFFAGMSPREIALVLGVSVRTVELDWRIARAWLRRELEKGIA